MFGEAWPDFPAADFDYIKAAARFRRHQLLHARRDEERSGASRSSAPRACASRARSTPRPDWEVHAPALTDILLWFRDRYGADADLHHRKRRRLLRSADRDQRRRSTIPLRVHYLREHIRAVARRDRHRASTSAATSSGPSSTTSNGPSATPNASASSTSTSRR